MRGIHRNTFYYIYQNWLTSSSWCVIVACVSTVYPKKYAHGFCFAVLCCGYTLTDFPISIRLTSPALGQSNDCPSAGKATLMNMDKYFMWIHYERLHNHNKAKHNKTVCIFLGMYCISVLVRVWLSVRSIATDLVTFSPDVSTWFWGCRIWPVWVKNNVKPNQPINHGCCLEWMEINLASSVWCVWVDYKLTLIKLMVRVGEVVNKSLSGRIMDKNWVILMRRLVPIYSM